MVVPSIVAYAGVDTVIKFPNLVLLIAPDQNAVSWPDELRVRGFEIELQTIDGLRRGHFVAAGARLFLSEQVGPDPRYNKGPIAGKRLIMLYTGKGTDRDSAASAIVLLERVIAVLESLGATQLRRP